MAVVLSEANDELFMGGSEMGEPASNTKTSSNLSPLSLDDLRSELVRMRNEIQRPQTEMNGLREAPKSSNNK